MAHINNRGYAVVSTDPNTIPELQSGHSIKKAIFEDGTREWVYNIDEPLNSRWIESVGSSTNEIRFGKDIKLNKDQIVGADAGVLVTRLVNGKKIVEAVSEFRSNINSIVVENYEDIPFKEGVYVLGNGTNAFSDNYQTDITNLETGLRVLLNDVSVEENVAYVKREIVENTIQGSVLKYAKNRVFDIFDNPICEVGVIGDASFVRFDVDFFNLRFKANYRLINGGRFFTHLTFSNETYSETNAVKNSSSYENINPASRISNLSLTINGEDATGAVKVGLLSGDDNIIAFEPNDVWTKDRLQGARVVMSFENTGRETPRIANVSRENFTGVNAASAENQPYHGGKMQEVFASAYGNFTANFVNGIEGDVDNVGFENLTQNEYIQDTLINANADIIFGATGTGFISSLFLNYPQGVFKVFPNGANTVTRDDNGFDNDTQFLTNGVLVTSRDDDDLDGSDPTGTSYGFGVEFNEPTRDSDLQAQGFDWFGSVDEHSQSKATAIVAGKLKYIKDQTGAPWYLVREAARQTASHANSYNIYTGFGVIDKAAAITWLSDKEWEEEVKEVNLDNLEIGTSEEFSVDKSASKTVTVGNVFNLSNRNLTDGDIFVNAYFDGVFKRITDGECSLLRFQSNGRISVFKGGAGSAGSTITFTRIFELTSDGIIKQQGNLMLFTTGTPPTSSTSSGVKNQVEYDGNYIYHCVNTNTWVRIAKDNNW